ncbi:MAG: diguanylate cyclase [Anaerolineales bacterium]|nr:diguanylate cyclase [Anaerolineales bacterium]
MGKVDEPGQIIGYLGIQRDVTERKLAEQALRSAEANFRSIFENATVGIYQSTLDGRFLRVNQVMAHIFGYNSPQEMVDDIISIEKQYYVDPADRREFTRLMIEHGQVHEFNSMNYRKDGSHIHVQESARAVKDQHGNIQYYEGFVTDITARKHAEESLRESESRFRYMADTTPVMVWMADADAMCNYFNKRWLDFTGRTMEQESGYGWMDGVHPDDREHCVDIYTNAVKARREFKMEFRLRSADDRYRWLLDHGVPRFSMDGEFFGFIGSCFDISDLKQAEDELSRANASLTIAHRDLEKSLLHEQVLARTDGLTGLYNYRYFFELASYEFEASDRYQRPLSIIIFDTDHLKQVNDTLGHLAGDRMLITVAKTASSQIRSVDSLARYGGDEFVILLPQTTEQMAFSIAERIRENVAALRMETEKGPLSVTLSLGVAGMSRDPVDESIEQVVQRADKALYAAKQAGRNRTELFTAE